MNILFVSLSQFKSLDEDTVYTGPLRKFVREGHHVDAISPIEKRNNEPTQIHTDDKGNRILNLRIGNIQKCNPIEKGINTLLLEDVLIKGIKKYFNDVKYDLVLYSTPPITFEKAVRYVKKRDGARTYLLLKDIFPQNAVDIGMMKKSSVLYKMFRKKEQKLYEGADMIGCMSPANVEYILAHNPEISREKVEVCPNSVEPTESISYDKKMFRTEYDIPKDVTVFVYGGNLGKPQDVSFIVEVLKQNVEKKDRYFIVCGTGTDSYKIKDFMEAENPSNMRYISGLPKKDYEKMLRACDVGMIFLDHRFTIPNFPSRLLSYMDYGMPVVAFTDRNTDIGKIVTDNGFGWWEESTEVAACNIVIDKICSLDDSKLLEMGKIGRDYLLMHYDARNIEIR